MSYGNGYLQDIHIDDVATWKELQNNWELEDYSSILSTLNPNNHPELISKYVSAAYLNNLTTRLYTRETDIDPNFAKNRIQVSSIPPSLLNGEVYFQEEIEKATILTLNLTSDLTQNLYFTQSAPNGVTIDWGDGSEADTIADLSAIATHTYANAGNYTVSMTAVNDVSWEPGAVIDNVNYSMGGNASNKNNTYPTITSFLFGVGCGMREYSFACCTGITDIVIPSGITEIPNYAFQGCRGLLNITLPSSLRYAHVNTFNNATNITNVYINNLAAYCEFDWVVEDTANALAYPSIGSMNLYLNGVKITEGNLEVPFGVTRIGNQTFANALFANVVLPSSVTNIGHGAFSSSNVTSTIEKFTFGTNSINFGQNAFLNRGITEVYFPSYEMWLGCVYTPGGFGMSSPTSNSNTIVYINGNRLPANLEIPRSITTLHAMAFSNRQELTAVWIHDTVDTIEVVEITSNNSTTYYRPFYNCSTNLQIYCEDVSEQAGWDSGWNGSLNVIYGQTTSPW